MFHKPSKKDDIPLHIPKLITNKYEIQREESINFLGVLVDQYLTKRKLTEKHAIFKASTKTKLGLLKNAIVYF